uniref:Coenzyme Q-binding protein COQ10 START domain-containing protein n=1 Tax=Tetradesmus obliquus TaxID=3088 RepID=A0A383WN78_TETOB|eukprot:jgi/Sobl393_1/14722/SZX67138.1
MRSQLQAGQRALGCPRSGIINLGHQQYRAFVKPGASTATKKHSGSQSVAVELTNTSFSSRKLNATVLIGAPLDVVWGALTDYDNLGTFIPSLVENRCLERRPQGCLLYQVGAQDVAMGVKFSAACTLEIQEYPMGIPDGLCTVDGNWDYYFPRPWGGSSSNDSTSASVSSMSSMEVDVWRDISFSAVEGDFKAFKGIWRIQMNDEDSSFLHYSLFVKPHPWLPVGLIQSRIKNEVVTNLKAVRRHTEHVYKRQVKQQQQQQQAGAGPLSSASSSTMSSSTLSTSSSVGTDADDTAGSGM